MANNNNDKLILIEHDIDVLNKEMKTYVKANSLSRLVSAARSKAQADAIIKEEVRKAWFYTWGKGSVNRDHLENVVKALNASPNDALLVAKVYATLLNAVTYDDQGVIKPMIAAEVVVDSAKRTVRLKFDKNKSKIRPNDLIKLRNAFLTYDRESGYRKKLIDLTKQQKVKEDITDPEELHKKEMQAIKRVAGEKGSLVKQLKHVEAALNLMGDLQNPNAAEEQLLKQARGLYSDLNKVLAKIKNIK